MIRLYYSSKNPCTAALPPVGIQLSPQCVISPDYPEPLAKLQILFVFQRSKKKKVRKSLEYWRIIPIFATSKQQFWLSG